MRSPKERFMSLVDVTGYEPSACWVWRGNLNNKGYGMFRWVHENRRTWQAHRAAYLMFVGHIADGLEIDHLCHNRRCVRPTHLEAVAHAENLRRAGEARDGHCPRGHDLAEVGVYDDPRGSRRCMECARIARRKYNQKLTEVSV